MKKKVVVLLVVLAMALTGVAAAIAMIYSSSRTSQEEKVSESRDESQQARETVKDTMVFLKKGETLGALENFTENADTNGFKLKKQYDQYTKDLEGLESEEVKNAFNNYYHFIVASRFRDYTIESVDVEDDTATAEVTVLTVDSDKIPEVSEEQITKFAEQYVTEHQDELNALLAESKEKADAKVQEAASIETYRLNTEAVRNTATIEKTYKFTLKETDGKWKITQIEEIEKES